MEVYDFHTRFYDAVIGRFMTQDALAEEAYD
ncbi:MAG: RHS repeat-associated core domain-containing protein, partial [Bacteroidota bacterium]